MQKTAERESVVVLTHRIDLRHLGLGVDFIDWPVPVCLADAPCEVRIKEIRELKEKEEGWRVAIEKRINSRRPTFSRRIFEN